MQELEITPATRPFRATVQIPGSKSITNRALPLAALAQGQSTLSGVLFADDTWQMINALQTLGYDLALNQKERVIRIIGRGAEIPAVKPPRNRLMCGNSGTTIRFLAAMLTLGTGEYILDGVPRMRERPIDQLVDQLQKLGAKISYEIRPGYPPIHIQGGGGSAGGLEGGPCSFSDAKSSQYISAILMAAPYARNPVDLTLLGPITSEPYVVMTLRMMEQFGVSASILDQCVQPASRVIRVPTGEYKPRSYGIEPDASNASYFLAAAALTPGSSVTIPGLSKSSLQGDAHFADVLGRMGAKVEWSAEAVQVSAPASGQLRGIDLDMNHMPDMVQTLAVVALFAEGPTTARNIWNLRVKETDRLAALETELAKLRAKIQTGRDWITITPPVRLTPASIATYDDHRMAMAFAVAGLRMPPDGPPLRIENPQCTAKTYPDYFHDLQAMVATLATP